MPESQNTLRALLIADADSSTLRDALAREQGVTLESAPTFEAAVLRLHREDLDIVLIEQEASLREQLAAIERLNAELPGVAVVVVTERDDDDAAAAALQAGAEDCLVKGGVDGPSLRRSLRNAVERHSYRSALSASEARHAMLVDSIPDVAWTMDRTGSLVFVGANAPRVWGREASELEGAPVEDRLRDIQPEDRQRVRELLAAHFEAGRESESEIEYALYVPGGDVRWVREHWGRPYYVGRTACCSGTTSDVTARKSAERQLEASQARMQAIFDNAQDAILLVSSSGRYVDANPAACRMLGWTREEILERRVGDFTHPSAIEATRRIVATLADQGRTSGEHVVMRRDGRSMTIEYNGVANVQPGVDLWIFTDIEPRRREEDLRRLLASVVENSDDAIVTKDLTGIVTSWNRGAERTFGWTAEEMIGASINRIIPEERLGEDAGILQRLVEGQRIEHFETQRVTRDGRLVDISLSASPLADELGRIRGVSKIARDVTERKRAEQALVESEARLQRAQRVAHLGSWEVALPGGEMKWSQEVPRILGIDAATPATMAAFLDRIHPEDVGAFLRVLDKAEAEGGSHQVEHRLRHPDGTERIACGQVEPCGRRGAYVVIQGITWDVTDRRQLEEQLLHAQKMEAVGRLAGGVAHDFNNLLTIIGGYANLLLDDLEPDSPFREHVMEIAASGERAARLTRQLLAFSRKQVLRPAVIAVDDLVLGMEKMLGRLLGEDVVLEVRCEDRPCRILADPGQIEQVLMNMAVNARDAMPEGGRLTVEVRRIHLSEKYAEAHADVVPGPYVQIVVTDTGAGMDRTTLARLFEPFFTTKPVGSGTGLGLSTAYGIVRQSNGHIWVYSEPGHGSTFKIYLPCVEEGVGDRRERVSAPGRFAGRETVLVVEDEAPLRMFACQVLQRQGYRVLDAGSPDEAIEKLGAADSIGLLLTDVVLPGRSGRRLADEILARQPGARVVFMSGYTPGTVQQHGLLAPDVHFLQKPFTPTSLLEKVREALDQGAGTQPLQTGG